MKVSKEQIKSVIPQRTPFIMIDNLVEATSHKFVTDFLILSDNIFLEELVLREFALIENIAQSGAAGIGFLNKSDKARQINGFIGSISKLTVYSLPKVDDKIDTIVMKLYQLENMYLLKGINYVNGKRLIECELKLVGSVSNQSVY